MNLRQRNYPAKFWFKLHNHIQDPLPPVPPKKTRPPSTTKLNACLLHLNPHLQRLIYRGAIDKKKGEIRSDRIPISPEQYRLIHQLGATHKYKEMLPFEQVLQLEYNFIYKGYHRGIEHIQFRLQQQKSVIIGKMINTSKSQLMLV